MGWFHNWFGTEYYDLLYSHRDEEEAKEFLENLTRHFNWQKGARILDVGCGKGRHSRTLASMGFDVTGIDVVPENIIQAGKYEKPGLHFEIQDMRKPFKTGGFDAALNLFTSFGYFETEEEDITSLKNIHDALKDGGCFVMDFLNAWPVRAKLVPEETVQRGDITFYIRRFVKDGFVKKEITVQDGAERHTYMEQVKLLELPHLERYFEAAGFVIEETFGNYRLEPYRKESSDRLIITARKKS